MEFVLNGQRVVLHAATVVSRLAGQVPEPVQQHGVRVGGVVFPVKQAFSAATGCPRQDFTTKTAQRHLARLGFELLGTPTPRHDEAMAAPVAVVATTGPPVDPRGWPWEGQVQALFAARLHAHGWSVTAMADTAARAPGVDVVAHKGARWLGAEVKGWPSTGYADPGRAREPKPTRPSTQAGHWYAQAVTKALMLLDSHPGHESLVVLPDYPRYRDLAARTGTGLTAAGVHVIFLSQDGQVRSETWTP